MPDNKFIIYSQQAGRFTCVNFFNCRFYASIVFKGIRDHIRKL